jgi:hypothetical protein
VLFYVFFRKIINSMKIPNQKRSRGGVQYRLAAGADVPLAPVRDAIGQGAGRGGEAGRRLVRASVLLPRPYREGQIECVIIVEEQAAANRCFGRFFWQLFLGFLRLKPLSQVFMGNWMPQNRIAFLSRSFCHRIFQHLVGNDPKLLQLDDGAAALHHVRSYWRLVLERGSKAANGYSR